MKNYRVKCDENFVWIREEGSTCAIARLCGPSNGWLISLASLCEREEGGLSERENTGEGWGDG